MLRFSGLTTLLCVAALSTAAVSTSPDSDGKWAGHNYAAGANEDGSQKAGRRSRLHKQVPTASNSRSQRSEETSRGSFDWDGNNSWEWDNSRTLYIEPVAGLGNRLRTVASAVVLAKEFGIGLKVIWREEEFIAGYNPGFNSTWEDLFSEPHLRLADNFPGSTYSTTEELNFLRAVNRDEFTPPLQPGQCYIHVPSSHREMRTILETGWQKAGAEEVICVRAAVWLTEQGEKEGKFFFRLLRPSPHVKALIDNFKVENNWNDHHVVGVHVRRGDLTIYGKNNQHTQITSLIPLEKYTEAMRKQLALAEGLEWGVKFLLATDDAESEAAVKAAFPKDAVIVFGKKHWDRTAVAGIQEALAEILLLAECPVLIGTYYSSFSEAAKMIGWPFYIQIGHELHRLSKETVFGKGNPEEQQLVAATG